ncbi:unnamed protein product [Fusarium graminearum]|nr:unnamed protein product [Fusarium graminearum]
MYEYECCFSCLRHVRLASAFSDPPEQFANVYVTVRYHLWQLGCATD